MIKIAIFLICIISPMMSLSTNDNHENFLPIEKLLPDLKSPPQIQIYLPKNFVCIPVQELISQGGQELYFWGPEKILRTCCKEVNNAEQHGLLIDPSRPILIVQTPSSALQVGDDSFNIEDKLKKISSVEVKKYKWGKYPVLAVENKVKGISYFGAYVGLNSGGETIFISLCPSKDGHLRNHVLWQEMLEKSKFIEVTN